MPATTHGKRNSSAGADGRGGPARVEHERRPVAPLSSHRSHAGRARSEQGSLATPRRQPWRDRWHSYVPRFAGEPSDYRENSLNFPHREAARNPVRPGPRPPPAFRNNSHHGATRPEWPVRQPPPGCDCHAPRLRTHIAPVPNEVVRPMSRATTGQKSTYGYTFAGSSQSIVSIVPHTVAVVTAIDISAAVSATTKQTPSFSR